MTFDDLLEMVEEYDHAVTQAIAWMSTDPAKDDPIRCPPDWLNAYAPKYAAEHATRAAHIANQITRLLEAAEGA